MSRLVGHRSATAGEKDDGEDESEAEHLDEDTPPSRKPSRSEEGWETWRGDGCWDAC